MRKILIIGPKEYPFGSGSKLGELPGGGAERFLSNLLLSVKDSKFRFILITQLFPGLPKYEKINNLEVYRVNWIRGEYRPVSYLLFMFLKSLRINFDIVLTLLEPPLFFGFFLSKFKEAKLYCRMGGFHKKTNSSKKMYHRPLGDKFELSILNFFTNYVLYRADKVIFSSQRESLEFEKYYEKKLPNLKIIQTGIIGMPQKESVKINSITKLLYVGRLENVKGIETAIKALDSVPNSLLFVVGDGRLLNHLKQLVRIRRLRNRIKFFGFRRNVSDFFNKSDIFILPSLSDGTPHTLLEAMSTKIPIVASDVGYEEIKHEHSAYIFKKGNESDLAEKINFLVNNPSARKKIVDNAFSDFRKKHMSSDMIKNYISIINE